MCNEVSPSPSHDTKHVEVRLVDQMKACNMLPLFWSFLPSQTISINFDVVAKSCPKDWLYFFLRICASCFVNSGFGIKTHKIPRIQSCAVTKVLELVRFKLQNDSAGQPICMNSSISNPFKATPTFLIIEIRLFWSRALTAIRLPH